MERRTAELSRAHAALERSRRTMSVHVCLQVPGTGAHLVAHLAHMGRLTDLGQVQMDLLCRAELARTVDTLEADIVLRGHTVGRRRREARLRLLGR